MYEYYMVIRQTQFPGVFIAKSDSIDVGYLGGAEPSKHEFQRVSNSTYVHQLERDVRFSPALWATAIVCDCSIKYEPRYGVSGLAFGGAFDRLAWVMGLRGMDLEKINMVVKA
jgi:hypothetical protein